MIRRNVRIGRVPEDRRETLAGAFQRAFGKRLEFCECGQPGFVAVSVPEITRRPLIQRYADAVKLFNLSLEANHE